MKNYTKLFEEFSDETEGFDDEMEEHEHDDGQRWVVYHHGDGMIYGIFDDEAEAQQVYDEERRGDGPNWEGDEDDDEEPDDENDEVTMREIDPYDEEDMREYFRCAINWRDLNATIELIMISPDPAKLFETPEEMYDYFIGGELNANHFPRTVLDRLPRDLRDRIKRSAKSEKLFGI